MADDFKLMTAEEAVQFVRVEYGPVTHIILDRPQARNAISIAMQERLIAILEDCSSRDDVKVLIIRGAGKMFCAGGDIKEYVALKKREAFPLDIQFCQLMASYPKPVIIVVQGYAGPAALECLVPYADMLVAVEGAQFNYDVLNVFATLGGRTLAWKLGPNMANELALLAYYLTAERLYELGVVNHVAPDLDQAVAVAQQWADRMASQPIERLTAQKVAFRATFGQTELPYDEWVLYAKTARAAGEAVHQAFDQQVRTGGMKSALDFRDSVADGKGR